MLSEGVNGITWISLSKWTENISLSHPLNLAKNSFYYKKHAWIKVHSKDKQQENDFFSGKCSVWTRWEIPGDYTAVLKTWFTATKKNKQKNSLQIPLAKKWAYEVC